MEDWLPVWTEEWLRAWSLWWSGTKLPDNLPLWGLNIIWWNRIGQCLQFLGSAVVIIDIVGPKKVRDWGYSINKRSLRFFMILINLLIKIVEIMYHKRSDWFVLNFAIILVIFIIVPLAFGIALFDPPDGMSIGEAFSDNLEQLFTIVFLTLDLISRTFPSLIIIIFGTPLAILQFLIVLSMIMVHSRAEKIFQFLSIVAIFLGVHFTLLAS